MKWFKTALIKSYFEKGYGLTHYIKYVIALFGLASQDLSTTMWMAFVYDISCFILGYWAYHSGFVEAETEVSNRFNLFVIEMRKKTFK